MNQNKYQTEIENILAIANQKNIISEVEASEFKVKFETAIEVKQHLKDHYGTHPNFNDFLEEIALHTYHHSAVEFGHIAVANKYISKHVFDEILIQKKIHKNQYGSNKKIGEILVDKGLMKKEQVEAVLDHQEHAKLHLMSQSNEEPGSSSGEITALEIKRYHDQIHELDNERSIEIFKKNFDKKLFLAEQYQYSPESFLGFIKDKTKGHYEITKTLHQQSIFITLLARDLSTNREVVLKVLRPGPHFKKDVAERLFRECTILSKLQHQNLPSIVDFGHIECFPYFSHAYIDGDNIIDYFQNNPSDELTKLSLFKKVCNALQQLHSQYIRHKNINATNIIITQEKEVFFLNYGISKSVQTISPLSDQTKNFDLILDSLAYISPEESAGKTEEIDERSEIYSLGVILYQLISRHLPYDIENCDLFLALTKVQEEIPWPISLYLPSIHQDLETIISKCLMKEKAERYQSVEELIQDLSLLAEQKPIKSKVSHKESDQLLIHKLKSRYTLIFKILSMLILILFSIVLVMAMTPDRETLRLRTLINTPKRAVLNQKLFAKNLNIPLKFQNKLGIEFILIPPGTFEMGAHPTDPHKSEDESLHDVTITKGFYLSKTEITQEQWLKLIEKNPSQFIGEQNPVDNVSWFDTQKYINLLNQQDSKKLYRLPTEAEWEYAAKAGSTWFYQSEDRLENLGWFKENSNNSTQKVGQKKPNHYGLFDIHNNVFEWCQDYYETYNPQQKQDPRGPLKGTDKVMRGGSYSSLPKSSRNCARRAKKPDYTSPSVGFRLLMEIQDKKLEANK